MECVLIVLSEDKLHMVTTVNFNDRRQIFLTKSLIAVSVQYPNM